MTHQTAEATRARLRVPSYPVLLAFAFGICVIGMSISILAEIAFGYVGSGDQPRSLEEQLAGVLGFGTAGLLV